MAREIFGRGKDRQEILRGVYEDNLRTVKGAPAAEPSGRPRRLARRLRRTGLLLLVFIAVAGFVYQGIEGNAFDVFGAAGLHLPEREASPREVALPVAAPYGAALAEPGPPSVMQELSVVNLSIAELYGLHVRTIIIDPGHGGADPGTRGQLGTVEKDIALDVARRLKARLERQHGFRVLMTRYGDEKKSLRERIAFANASNADLFISIHVNWLPVDTVKAIETYYFGVQADEQTLRLAHRENADSEYSVAEFQSMIQRLDETVKLQESRGVALSIQRSLYRNMRRLDESVTSWGVKRAPFMVLLGVEAPSVLAEIACISNKEEEAKLNTGEHREKMAMFLEEGIVNYLKQRPHTKDSTEGATAYGKEKDD